MADEPDLVIGSRWVSDRADGSLGKAARKRVPRTSLGDWDPSRRGHDALETVLSQNAIRDQRLVPMRHGRMSASPWICRAYTVLPMSRLTRSEMGMIDENRMRKRKM